MRKIKFRAWDNVANEMHFAGEDIDLLFQLGSEGIECTDIREMTSCGSCLGEMEHLIYMQHTGLEDEDGEEIYEGDIIDFGGGPFKVVFEKGCFYAWTPHDSEFLHLINHLSEVVGNAYEKPEFLEEEKA